VAYLQHSLSVLCNPFPSVHAPRIATFFDFVLEEREALKIDSDWVASSRLLVAPKAMR